MDKKDEAKKYFDIAPPKHILPQAAPSSGFFKKPMTPSEENDKDVKEQDNGEEYLKSTENRDYLSGHVSHPDFEIKKESDQVEGDSAAEPEQVDEQNSDVALGDNEANEENSTAEETEANQELSEHETPEEPQEKGGDLDHDPIPTDNESKTLQDAKEEQTDRENSYQVEKSDESSQENQPESTKEILTTIPDESPSDSVSTAGNVYSSRQDIQEPKIFDTKKYYVPIGHAHHRHGGFKGAVIFGIIFALIVVGGVIYYLYTKG